MEKVIKMENVSWSRDGKRILHNIDWEVNKNEHWAVLGLNGAGKTSLLNMVNGYIWPSTGEVSVLGREFGKTDMHHLRKSIGWVSSSMADRMSGGHPTEDIVVSGKFSAAGIVFADPLQTDFVRARRLMRLLGVEHVYGQAYEKCSNGEKQKILIARGLMADPKLLILDEPTSGLDFVAREELLTTIEDLIAKEDAPTIIFVSHHIEEVLPVFTHALLLKDGTIFAQGKREAVLTSDNMSQLYGKDIKVDWQRERAWMSLM